MPAGAPKKPAPEKHIVAQNKAASTPKKIAPPAAKKPTIAKSIASVKSKPTEIKKTEQKKVIPTPEKAIPTPKPIKQPEPIIQKIEQLKPEPAPLQPIIPENARISDDYREVEAMRRAAQLQKELIKNWKAPIGVPKNCSCDISITVTPKGAITNLKMIKPSGIVIYDVSARQALFR